MQGIALYAIELPANGTSWFANGVRVAATVSDDLRSAVAGLTATHSLGVFVTGIRARAHATTTSVAVPRYDHPVLRPHPRTGREVVFITELQVERINGVAPAESDALLAHLYSSGNVYEHRWQVGDLLIWDNQALQHRREDVTTAKPRTFRRNSLNTARWVDLVGSYTR